MLHSSISQVPTIFVGLVDVAVQQLEAEPLGAGLLQQPLRLGARLLDVGPEPGDLLQLLLGRGQRRAGEDDAADRMHVGDLGQRRRAVPAVDRQGQRAAHPHVVERLLLVVGRDDVAAVPVALLHRDLVAELLDELVARRGRQAAELDRRAVGADRVDADRLLGGEDADEAVEIGQALVVIVGVAHALDRLAGLVAGELERAGAHDVLLVPVRVLVEDLLLVDPGEGVGERRQKRGGREFQLEHDGRRVGRLDLVDHDRNSSRARSVTPSGGKDDLVPARRHVGGGQRRCRRGT